MRTWGFVALLIVAGRSVAWAADPTPAPTTLDSCPNDLLATGEYATLVRAQRDAYEMEVAKLRAAVKVLEAWRAKAHAEPPKPEESR